jgi:3-hydroxyacyl-[acyl-carrier-protein] dehydratase
MSEIETLLPHRDPFLFVDSVEVVDETHFVGTYRFNPANPIFKGHFPEFPVVPGVLMVECMAQCGGAGLAKAGRIRPDSGILLASILSSKFRRTVRPGDAITFEIETLKSTRRILCQRGKALVDGNVATEAEWVCMVGGIPSDSP